ncbi:MAG TPA: hypothetical protein VIF62_16500 [Labilithrix sp.]|jgi:hypothetical protein
MRRVLVLLLVAACGGATASVSGAGVDGGGGDDAGSSGDAASKPRLADLETCDTPGQCEIDAPGCCGLNCQAQDQLIAVRRGTEQQVVAASCDQSGPVACPGCLARIDPSIQPFCRGGKCAVVDLRTDTISACKTTADCELRYASCCQPCNGGPIDQIVAIATSGEGELALQLCVGNESCDKCLPSFSGSMHAECNTSSGHCEVVGN